jgi:hypothetical protein
MSPLLGTKKLWTVASALNPTPNSSQKRHWKAIQWRFKIVVANSLSETFSAFAGD